MRSLYKEFPDWDGGDLPLLPPFALNAWHNNPCPRYQYAAPDNPSLFVLFVDYESPDKREDPEQPRFNLYLDGVDQHVLDAETWDELRMKCNDYLLVEQGEVPDRTAIAETGHIAPLGSLLYRVCLASRAEQKKQINLEAESLRAHNDTLRDALRGLVWALKEDRRNAGGYYLPPERKTLFDHCHDLLWGEPTP